MRGGRTVWPEKVLRGLVTPSAHTWMRRSVEHDANDWLLRQSTSSVGAGAQGGREWGGGGGWGGRNRSHEKEAVHFGAWQWAYQLYDGDGCCERIICGA